MKYSVWNNNGSYSVYESPFRPVRRMNSSTNLGAIPQEIVSILPDSKYLGESEHAVGQIVVKTIGFREFLIFAAAAVLARFIYDLLK